MKYWTTSRPETKPTSKTSQNKKISLKTMKITGQGSQVTEYSTACNSIKSSTNKKSIKDLLQSSRTSARGTDQYLSMSYLDIMSLQIKPTSNFLSNLFCSPKVTYPTEGCSCQPKCIWMDYWLSLSSNSSQNYNLYHVSQQTDQQIRKDICRTQPGHQQFNKLHYQQALYQCLYKYAEIDPEIGYIQGMNIICSVLIYHGNSLDQCMEVFKYLMITCSFRKLYLRGFEHTYNIARTLETCLKFRCFDIYLHIYHTCQVNLEQFVIGWMIPLLGNIVPLNSMHMVITIFLEKGWIGLIKIIMSLLLYLKDEIMSMREQSELMHMLCTQKLRTKQIQWQQLIKSSSNIKNLPISSI